MHKKTAFILVIFTALFTLSMRQTFNSNSSYKDIIEEGLIPWRTPDANGMACANCHAPDALDLAVFNFSDANIRRRDEFHLSTEETDKIIAMIHALRDSFGLNNQLLDPLNDRPFQPGGYFIEGSTSQERDLNTALQVFSIQLPTLFGRVSTMEDALAAQAEILNFNLREQPCGVPFPRLSEDIFHGPEHGSLNDWLTDFPLIPASEQDALDWYALQDTYLANPNAENFWAMYNGLNTHLDLGGTTNAHEISKQKFRSLLLGQHLWREEALGLTDISENLPLRFVEFPPENNVNTILHDPLFDVGSKAHKRMPDEEDYPPLVTYNLSGDFRDGIIAMRLPWWYLGWTFNPFLDQIGNRHEYFPQGVFGHLSDTPYIIHHEFVHAKMDIERQFTARPKKTGQPYQSSNPTFSRAKSSFDPGYVNYENFFFNIEHELLYRTFSANIRRMLVWLMIDEVNRQCAAGENFNPRIGDVILWQEDLRYKILPQLIAWEPDYIIENTNLVDLAIATMEDAKRGCNVPAPPDGTGTGLLTNIYDQLNFTELLETRVDERINYYQKVARDPIIMPEAGDSIAVTWTGYLEPRFSETYEITVRHGQHCNPGLRLRIDGETIIEFQDGTIMTGTVVGYSGDHRFMGTVALEAQQQHEIIIEYTEPENDQSLRLSWESASQLEQVIPASQMYPADLALSVNDITLNGEMTDNGILLEWLPSSNASFYQYELQRAFDAIDVFETIWQSANFDFFPLEKAEFLDVKFQNRVNYYRLKITDKEGQTAFSNVVAIDAKRNTFEIFPNPVHNELRISFNEEIEMPSVCRIYNNQGQLVFSQSLNIAEHQQQLVLNIQELEAGVYFVQIGNEKAIKVVKLF